jgi:hypothetical protein
LYRYLYNFGSITNEEYSKYLFIGDGFVTKDVIRGINSVGLNDLHSIHIFFSIGLLFKNLIKSYDYYRYISDTIIEGIDIYNKVVNTDYIDYILDNDDKMALTYYTNILNNLKYGGDIKR